MMVIMMIKEIDGDGDNMKMMMMIIKDYHEDIDYCDSRSLMGP